MAAKQQRLTPPTAPAASKRKGKSGNPAARVYADVRPARFSDWVAGARIPTLSMSVSPVLVGTGAAVAAGDPGEFHWVRALLCLVVAVSLQIAVNYANDYSDGIRGTDRDRVGPFRLVGSGKATPKAVLTAALIFFGIAAVAGLVLTVVTQLWWLIAVGAVAIVAAWFYTGGKRPYGYLALGELFVFIFFGLVATLGTTYVQIMNLTQEAWLGAVGVGLISVATLIVNNIRDIEQDRIAGKRTLTTFLGTIPSRILYIVCLLVPFGIAAWIALLYPIAWFALFALLAALPAAIIVATARTAREYILALKLTGLTQLLYGIALFWALWK
ncbi:1,4-dihydroxy-2-naphthoate polyprenyltransferase [Mycetocola zhujimingii]|uniref:1,4-dihydroxy-2-naphthoate octaprenyltransferase n=1 Tax=Mycetocola zhujimingii TaxID=2079792 RepID=A0A2U1TA93_9MICO|nr:1,4-dihydroxy-2-naphthoate polyprenyltransferase [Mycetocola zhujimingii]AWB85476.1 1,4-dihydroxy-2-naphthoate polyprenyltransferase [Mycetocola zhujimingii]PWC04616.1 1,4-dihydroxy-2-naphthoate polyprenyltransferase [Mycetocola zhujimingii]